MPGGRWGGEELNLTSHLTLLERAGFPSNIEPATRTTQGYPTKKRESAETPAILGISEIPHGALS